MALGLESYTKGQQRVRMWGVVGGMSEWTERRFGCKMFMGTAEHILFTGLMARMAPNHLSLFSPTPSQASHGSLHVGLGAKRVMIIGIGFNFVETTYSVWFTYFPGVLWGFFPDGMVESIIHKVQRCIVLKILPAWSFIAVRKGQMFNTAGFYI